MTAFDESRHSILANQKTRINTSVIRSKADIRLVSLRKAANDCDFNRSMQHLNSITREGGVADELPDEEIHYRA